MNVLELNGLCIKFRVQLQVGSMNGRHSLDSIRWLRGSSPNETRLERKTVRYARPDKTVGYDSSSSATPFLSDSDKDLVVETETLILRHNMPNFMDSKEGIGFNSL